VRCGQCGASFGQDDRFCGDCGAPAGACPSCGEPLVPGKRFCRACGSAVPDTGLARPAAVSPPSAALAPGRGGGHRRSPRHRQSPALPFAAGPRGESGPGDGLRQPPDADTPQPARNQLARASAPPQARGRVMLARVITAQAGAEGFDGTIRLAEQQLPARCMPEPQAVNTTPPPKRFQTGSWSAR
jgi:hypothetical protein